MAEPIIRTVGLRKSFGNKEVLKGIDLEVMPSECMVIIVIIAVAAITILVLLEKVAPQSWRLDYAVGTILVAWGAWVIVARGA